MIDLKSRLLKAFEYKDDIVDRDGNIYVHWNRRPLIERLIEATVELEAIDSARCEILFNAIEIELKRLEK